MMNSNIFAGRAALMLHDLGPRRFWPQIVKDGNWTKTDLGRAILEALRAHGLDKRDAYLSQGPDRAILHTDAGLMQILDPTLERHRGELDELLDAVAFGVAQERMMRSAGWKPGQDLPYWAITVSHFIVARLRAYRFTPTQLWNTAVDIGDDGYIDRRSFCVRTYDDLPGDPRSAFPEDCYVARYGTGLRVSWSDGDVHYQEGDDKIIVSMPLTSGFELKALPIVGSRVEDMRLGAANELLEALGEYTITATTILESSPNAILPEPRRLELRLAMPIRTLTAIPDAVCKQAGVIVPDTVDRDSPLWMATSPSQLRNYKPRRARAA